MGKIKELLIKYKELVLYVVFGVLTTVVSYASLRIFCTSRTWYRQRFRGCFQLPLRM